MSINEQNDSDTTAATGLLSDAIEKQPKPKRKSCLKRVLLVFGGGIVALFLWFGVFSGTVPLEISEETTIFTEPRTPDGKWIDYHKAIENLSYPPGMKTDTNGYRLIVRHLGIGKVWFYDHEKGETSENEEMQKLYEKKVYEKLGLDPEVKPDHEFVEFDQYVFDYAKEHFSDEAESNKYTSEILFRDTHGHELPESLDPIYEEWVRKYGASLDIVTEATLKPEFCFPIVTIDETQPLFMANVNMDIIQRSRSFARSYAARCDYRLAAGDIEGAMEDVLASHRLARFVGSEGPLVRGLVGIALEGISNYKGIAVNPEHQPTAEQIRRFMQQRDALPPIASFEEIMKMEHYYSLEALQGYASGRKASLGHPSPSVAALPGYDWNRVFKTFNRKFAEVQGTVVGTYEGHRSQFGSFNLLSRNARSDTLAETLSNLLFPAVQAGREAWRRVGCTNNMKRITLAMLLYDAENGTLPPSFSVDAEGKPLHSWRVLLLPYLNDENAEKLHSEIRLDEPWDSEYNRQFHDRVPEFYRCPSHRSLRPSDTIYTVIVGERTPFGSDGLGRKASDFSPVTMLLAEVSEAFHWMDPSGDIPYDIAVEGVKSQDPSSSVSSTAKLGSFHAGGCNLAHRSGSVSFHGTSGEQQRWLNMLGKEP